MNVTEGGRVAQQQNALTWEVEVTEKHRLTHSTPSAKPVA